MEPELSPVLDAHNAGSAPARDRWFWQPNYRHPAELGPRGFVDEYSQRLRELVVWTLGLALLPVAVVIAVVILVLAGAVVLALLQAGLIDPFSDQPNEPAREHSAVWRQPPPETDQGTPPVRSDVPAARVESATSD